MRSSRQSVTVFLLMILQVAVPWAQTVANAQSGSSGQMTRAAIDKIIAASEQLRAGNPAEAERQLAAVKSSLQALQTQAEQFRDVSNREHDRCVANQGVLQKNISDLFVQQRDLEQQMKRLEAELAAASQRKDLAQADLAKLNQDMDRTQAKLKERNDRLRELEKWWWVPGYNLYLAIRTLADKDIQNADNLASDLRDQQKRWSTHASAFDEAHRSVVKLEANMKDTDNLIDQLYQMRGLRQERLNELRRTGIFLTNSSVFWGLSLNAIEVRGDSFFSSMGILNDLLTSNVTAPSFTDPAKEEVGSFQGRIVELADSIDKNNNYLLQNTIDYCGGPPRLSEKITTSCNIRQFTKYYEILNPKTCEFAYRNPPGCPGQPRAVGINVNPGIHGNGVWTTTPNQNWIDKARCNSAAAFYYGRLPNPSKPENQTGDLNSRECERRCKADPECKVWTYNNYNRVMGLDSPGECWGGTSAIKKTTNNWPGFTSGGLQAP